MSNDWEDVYKYGERLLKYQPKKVEGIHYVNIAPPQKDLENLKCTFNTSAIIQPIRDKAKQVQDKTAINAIIDYAQKQGITDLFIIDEEFVKNAIKHEWEREHKPQTNFDKITQSVESLAVVLVDSTEEELEPNLLTYLDPINKCSTDDKGLAIRNTIKWLQKESEE